MPPGHALSRVRSVTLDRLAAERLVVFGRKDYADYHSLLDHVLATAQQKPTIAVECDGASSLFTEVEAGRGVAVLPQVFARIVGRRLVMRPLTPNPEPLLVGIARATRTDVTPAGERFCQLLRDAASP